MSNPLLKPNDPRFQKADVRDAAGQNRFGEAQPEGQPPGDAGRYAAAAEARPYQPQYEAQQPGRNGRLMTLAILGGACGILGSTSLTGLFLSLGWLLPLLGLVLAMTGWFLAHEDLKAAQQGAIAAEEVPMMRTAYWLSVASILLCLCVVAAMIWLGLSFLPDLF